MQVSADTVPQVFESITRFGIRSRSRPGFTDASMAVRAECIMLNKGPFLLDAVRLLDTALKCAQDHQHKKTFPFMYFTLVI